MAIIRGISRRYCEVLLIEKDWLQLYNTTGVSDCRAKVWESLDPEKVKAKFGVVGWKDQGLCL